MAELDCSPLIRAEGLWGPPPVRGVLRALRASDPERFPGVRDAAAREVSNAGQEGNLSTVY